MDRVKALSWAVLRLVQTRVELAGTELALEREALIERAQAALMCLVAAGLAGFSAIVLAAIALPERHRLTALAVLTGIFVAIAIGAYARGRRLGAERASLFTRLARQLRRDRAVFDGLGAAPPARSSPPATVP